MVNASQQIVVAFFWLLIQSTVASEDVFRLFFRYGFGDGQIGDPNSEPTEEDIKGLMCVTNKFLTDSLTNYTKNQGMEIFATEIDWGFEDWIYNGTEPEAPRNVPVIVNFTATVDTPEGMTPPTNQELWDATKYFDYFGYIMDYIWNIEGENFFKNTRGLWYEPEIIPPLSGQIPQNTDCPAPETAAPSRDQKFNLTTLSPTVLPSIAPSLAPSLISLSPSVGATTAPPVSRGGGLNLQTMSPTRPEDEMVYFTIQIDFFAGKEKQPTKPEIEKMMCKANQFFEKTLKEKVNPDVTVYATNIDWEWDPKAALPSVIEFFADARNSDGSHVPAVDVFSAMEQVDVKGFVESFVWESEPYKENIFYQTEDIFFAGSYTGSPNPPAPHPGKLQKVDNCS
ncbi:expressed unknown protein [Seminavis robusta]|uniref:Chitinase n=1 Tax=Seminavis robusta TaxID=568900 RepID=A0A9N8HUT6_9STRA|nr:expressed unknown protein [Seminavis robusta]|eukprot:Sro1806_g298920.1 n/a (396) ;mRNA; r:20469-21748